MGGEQKDEIEETVSSAPEGPPAGPSADDARAAATGTTSADGDERAWARRRMARAFAVISLLPVAMSAIAGRGLWWPQAAAAVGLGFVATLPCGATILKTNPSLVRERTRGIRNVGTAAFDKIIVPAVGALTLGTYLAAAVQHRLTGGACGAWSTPAVQTAGAALIAAGAGLLAWSVASNRFFSSVVRIQTDRRGDVGPHTVCDTGPYHYARHPGYTGFILLSAGEPLLLGSSWAAAAGAARSAALVIRVGLEERFLSARLPGYTGYAARVRWRLVPGLW